MATIHCQPTFRQLEENCKISDYVMGQQGKLLGHVIRADKSDPMRMPTINDRLETPGVYWKRVGRPRLGWVKEKCKWTSEHILHKPWDSDDEDNCINELIGQAMARKF